MSSHIFTRDKKAKDGKMRVRPSFIDSGEDFDGSECNEDQAVSSPQPESKGKKVKGNNWTPREKMVLMNEVMKGGGGKVSHLVFAPPPLFRSPFFL